MIRTGTGTSTYRIWIWEVKPQFYMIPQSKTISARIVQLHRCQRFCELRLQCRLRLLVHKSSFRDHF